VAGYTFYNVAEDGGHVKTKILEANCYSHFFYKIFSKLICQRLGTTLAAIKALTKQGLGLELVLKVPKPYCALLWKLYQNQSFPFREV
jgi:hypothetical protein